MTIVWVGRNAMDRRSSSCSKNFLEPGPRCFCPGSGMPRAAMNSLTRLQLDLASFSTPYDDSSDPTPTSSSPPSSVDTPAFEPNMPSSNLPPEFVNIRSVLASLSHKTPNRQATLDDVIIPELDYNLPISSLLRIGTSRAHIRAENSEGAGALVKGDLILEEYIRWLTVLWRVYR